MPITIRKIELFCSLLFFSPTSLQRAKNACFSLFFPEKSAFRNGFELRRSDVKKDFFFNIFRHRSVESSSDNFRFFPTNTVSCDIYQKTRNQFGSNATWVRIPPSAPKAAPCGVLLFIFAANYARAARWDSNSPCPALCVPPGCNSPADCCKGAGESHRLRHIRCRIERFYDGYFLFAASNYNVVSLRKGYYKPKLLATKIRSQKPFVARIVAHSS